MIVITTDTTAATATSNFFVPNKLEDQILFAINLDTLSSSSPHPLCQNTYLFELWFKKLQWVENSLTGGTDDCIYSKCYVNTHTHTHTHTLGQTHKGV